MIDDATTNGLARVRRAMAVGALAILALISIGASVRPAFANPPRCIDLACTADADCQRHTPCTACSGDAGKARCAE